MKLIIVSALVCISTLTLSSCTKGENPPLKPLSLKPNFKVEFFEVVESFKYKYENSNDSEISYRDTLINDSSFYLTRYSPVVPFDDVITVSMNLNARNTFLKEVKWKVGTENLFREGKSISIDFKNPIGTIPVQCFYSYDSSISSTEIVRLYDTIIKNITIGSINDFNFTYIGHDLSNPKDTFRVTIQYSSEPLIPSTGNKPFFNVKGLPFKYPYAVAINPKGNSFSSFESVNLYQLVRYGFSDGYYFSNWFGNGFFKSNFDSIYVEYSFLKQKNIIQDTTKRTQNRTFVGKRI